MTDTTDTTDTPRRQWHSALWHAGFAYLFSRLCVMAGAAIVAAELRADENLRVDRFPWMRIGDVHYANRPIPKTALRPIIDVLTSWDGIWYLRVVRLGYPTSIPKGVTWDDVQARAAFFPAYPTLVRWIDHVLPGGDTLAALFTNVVLGALAVWVVGLLARELFDIRIAERSMVLMAIFPGSFVLSFAYTEALLLVVAAACLLMLVRRRWWAAGVLAAIGTATRPNGIALIAACGVAAIIAIRERREWKALVAAVLSPLGFIAFQLVLDHHTGERGAWFRVQSEAWDEGTSFGWTALRRTGEAFIHPLSSPTNIITGVSLVTLIALCWMMYRHRLPAPLVAYVVVVVLLMLLPSTVTARPRFIYTAFPMLIAAAVWIERERPDWKGYVYAACAAGLVTLTGLYGVLGAIP